MACFKWEVELELVGGNKPRDARRLECVSRFEVTLDVIRLFFLFALYDQMLLCMWYRLDFLCLLIFVNPKEVCFLLKYMFWVQE